jgi:hypothetical protein
MSLPRKLALLFLVGAILTHPATGKVYARWTQSKFPQQKILGITEIVIPWTPEAPALAKDAKKQGYHVYIETTLDQAPTASAAAAPAGIAGIILQGAASDEGKLEEAAAQLRAKYPKLKILVLNANGKQPQMRGWLVFSNNGFLQVSSPSLQPWLDQNLAVVRYERTFYPVQTPLYTFSWNETDPLLKQNGPKPADYSLAIAETGAFHSDLILPIHEHQQKALLGGEKEAVSDWEPVKRTIAFYEHEKDQRQEAAAVAVLTDNYGTSYEAINLLARHNIPFQVFHSGNTKSTDLAGFALTLAFATPSKDLAETLRAFAEQGGVVVIVNQPGAYPWDLSNGKKNGASTTYAVGKGRVIELSEPVSDPETFAQDIRRLLTKQTVPVSLWNSLTTLVVEYPGTKAGEATLELINYNEEPTQVQVQVKGAYNSVKYESPDHTCCESLKPAQVNGFTEFVIPNLVNGGRVHLQPGKAAAKDEAKERIGD